MNWHLYCLEKAVISNPFMLEKVTVLNNHDKAKFNNSVFEDIKIIETEGEKQFLNFWEKRLVSAHKIYWATTTRSQLMIQWWQQL